MRFGNFKNKGLVDLAYYVLGDFFLKGIMFITLPLLTAFLSPSEYGILSILTSMVTFFAVIFSLNMENAINVFYMKNIENFGGYLFSNMVFIFFAQLIIFCVYSFFSNEIASLFGVTSHEVILVGALCIIISYYNIYMLLLQGAKKSKEFSIINVSNKLIEIALILFIAWFLVNAKYLSKIYAQMIAVSLFLPYIVYKLWRYCDKKFDIAQVKVSLAFAMPLIPHVLASAILSQSDRVMLNHYVGDNATGIYSFSYNVGLAIAVVISAWNSMWQPRFYDFIRTGKFCEINEGINFYGRLIAIVTVLSLVTLGPLVRFFVSDLYFDSVRLIPIVLCSNFLFFQYYVYVNYSFYYGKSFFISLSTIIAGGINILFNFVLIPRFGGVGAAISTLISYFFLVLLHYFNAVKVSGELKVVSFWIPFKYFPLVFIVTLVMVVLM